MPAERRVGAVAALGAAQTLAWASSYYLPAMLAAPMAKDIGVSTPTVFAAFSAALIVSAAVGPYAGRSIDRWGGRPVLAATNLVFAAGLVALAQAHDLIGMFAAWLILGIGMGSGLYEGAFAALVRLYGRDSRNVITGITLIAGFASTVGWPLSTFLESQFGWRSTCYAWAALHLVLGLPLNLSLPSAPAAPEAALPAQPALPDTSALDDDAHLRRSAVLLACAFAAVWFVSTAMAAHLPGLLLASGATLATAVGVSALVGPAQVAGRLLEFGVLRRIHPMLSARLAALMHPVGAAALVLSGAPAAAVFAVLHGAGNGILTIAKGTLPLVLFGPQGYGHRQGLLMVPARFAQACAPWLFGIALERWGAGAMWLSAALGLGAFVALLALPKPAERAGAIR
ncbi:MAG: MFS transporter [Burkholderiaceae bacterium]